MCQVTVVVLFTRWRCAWMSSGILQLATLIYTSRHLTPITPPFAMWSCILTLASVTSHLVISFGRFSLLLCLLPLMSVICSFCMRRCFLNDSWIQSNRRRKTIILRYTLIWVGPVCMSNRKHHSNRKEEKGLLGKWGKNGKWGKKTTTYKTNLLDISKN